MEAHTATPLITSTGIPGTVLVFKHYEREDADQPDQNVWRADRATAEVYGIVRSDLSGRQALLVSTTGKVTLIEEQEYGILQEDGGCQRATTVRRLWGFKVSDIPAVLPIAKALTTFVDMQLGACKPMAAEQVDGI